MNTLFFNDPYAVFDLLSLLKRSKKEIIHINDITAKDFICKLKDMDLDDKIVVCSKFKKEDYQEILPFLLNGVAFGLTLIFNEESEDQTIFKNKLGGELFFRIIDNVTIS